MIESDFYIHGKCSYCGSYGYNIHSRNFFNALSKLVDVEIDSYTQAEMGQLTESELKLLQRLPEHKTKGKRKVEIVLHEVNHPVFYQESGHGKIAYTVWESDELPDNFKNKLLEFEQVWVPTQWQKDIFISQGIPSDKIKIVHEGIDPELYNTFFVTDNDKFRDDYDIDKKALIYTIVGSWWYRKSTEELINVWYKWQKQTNNNAYLLLLTDNDFSSKSTHDRLNELYIDNPRIIPISRVNKNEYLRIIYNTDVFYSCSRSEGWNLPLYEAAACGKPCIYSLNTGQKTFHEILNINDDLAIKESGKYFPANIGEDPNMVGRYPEPDYLDLYPVLSSSYDAIRLYTVCAKSAAENKISKMTWYSSAATAYRNIHDLYCVNESDDTNVGEVISKNINNPVINENPKHEFFRLTFVNGARVDITGTNNELCKVDFINNETGSIEYSAQIKCGEWIETAKKYYVDWKIRISRDNNVLFEYDLDLNNADVFITLESKALGDNLAWIQPVEEFRLKHNCNIFLSTFYNHLFEKNYPEINFIPPGGVIKNFNAKYMIGCFDSNYEGNVINWRSSNLQDIARDILGLGGKESLARVSKYETPEITVLDKPMVCICPVSTMECKHWNYEGGWQEIVDYLNFEGFQVYDLSQYNKYNLKNVYRKHDMSLDVVMSYIKKSDFVIGLGSGLSWLSWALEKPVVMISGFSQPWCEFKTDNFRVINKNVCHGCFNDIYTNFDRSSDWCPHDKNYECTKEIKPKDVIEQIEKCRLYLNV